MNVAHHITRWNDADVGRTGYWGVPDAAIDWCELNYERSNYLAEAFNTISNAAFASLAVYGIVKAIQQRLPKRISLAFTGILIVGIGSALFHGTLMYTFQICDEMPMIYVSTWVAWIVFDVRPIGEPTNWVIPTSLALFDVFFTYSYLRFPNPVYHQVTYAILLIATTFRCVQLLFTYHVSHPINAQSRRAEIIGSLTFVAGFAIWNLDNVLCNSQVYPLKQRYGAPLSWILEGHAWWHLLTGLGSYYIVQALALITLAIRDSPDHYELVYTLRVLPHVRRTNAGWKAAEQRARQVVQGERTRLLPEGGAARQE